MNRNNSSESVKEVELTVNPEDFVKYEKIIVVFRLSHPDNSILSFLRKKERRVVEAVIDNPGITQAKLLNILDFSKPNLWRLVKSLENRGVIEREKYGKTYKLKCMVFQK